VGRPTKAMQEKKARERAAAEAAAEVAAEASQEPRIPKKTEEKSDPGSFFAAFSGNGSSDSETDDDDDNDEDDEPSRQQGISSTPSGGKHLSSTASKADNFDLGDGFSGLHNDDDDDLGKNGITANWNISKTTPKDNEKDKGGDDAEWGAAREEAAAVEARNKDRQAREEKLKADAELAKKQRLADAAAQSEKIKAQRLEEEEKAEQEKAEKEKKKQDEIAKARADARAQVESVEQTVDLDAQRDIMKQYEQSFLDKELGSASPSSDFGF